MEPATSVQNSEPAPCQMRQILNDHVLGNRENDEEDVLMSDPPSSAEASESETEYATSNAAIIQAFVVSQPKISFDIHERGHVYKDIAESTKCTATHVFISGSSSPLSIDYVNEARDQKFSGEEAFNLMLAIFPDLDKLHHHKESFNWPLESSSLAVRAVKHCTFNCTGQFVVAVKALLFDEPREIGYDNMDNDQIERTLTALLKNHRTKIVSSELHGANIFRILRSLDPQRQKSLGRNLETRRRGFKAVWHRLADSAMIAAIVCRAGVCPILKDLILASGNRQFVKVSPQAAQDDYWGVSMRAVESSILQPERWANKGENRLGWCYGRAREYLRGESFTEGFRDGRAPARIRRRFGG
ncbi:hypothetical protein H2200_006578 [Cladophialophora chaetospira]|uniref:NADAR domain-containing protein n=1 Tax=Cladophialophora chaetospira TaxID=386627 RepID=A0AA38X916_9EURO|nr:hypothetical protein H2200_006578 [Cladophialophora chaetospira]